VSRGEVVFWQLQDDGEESKDPAGYIQGFLGNVSSRNGRSSAELVGHTLENASISSLYESKKGWNGSCEFSGMNLGMFTDSTLSNTSVL
jgi:hypothetical protein